MLLKIYVITCIFSICSLFGVLISAKKKIIEELPDYKFENKISITHRFCLAIFITCIPIINIILAGIFLFSFEIFTNQIIEEIKTAKENIY